MSTTTSYRLSAIALLIGAALSIIYSASNAFIGILLLAIATLRARVFPRWIGWLLIATLILNAVSFFPFSPDALGIIADQLGYVTLAAFGFVLLKSSSREAVEYIPTNAPAEVSA